MKRINELINNLPEAPLVPSLESVESFLELSNARISRFVPYVPRNQAKLTVLLISTNGNTHDAYQHFIVAHCCK